MRTPTAYILSDCCTTRRGLRSVEDRDCQIEIQHLPPTEPITQRLSMTVASNRGSIVSIYVMGFIRVMGATGEEGGGGQRCGVWMSRRTEMETKTQLLLLSTPRPHTVTNDDTIRPFIQYRGHHPDIRAGWVREAGGGTVDLLAMAGWIAQAAHRAPRRRLTALSAWHGPQAGQHQRLPAVAAPGALQRCRLRLVLPRPPGGPPLHHPTTSSSRAWCTGGRPSRTCATTARTSTSTLRQPFLHHQPAQHNFYPDSPPTTRPRRGPSRHRCQARGHDVPQPQLIVPPSPRSTTSRASSPARPPRPPPPPALPATATTPDASAPPPTATAAATAPPRSPTSPTPRCRAAHRRRASKETQYLRRRCFNCHTTEPPSWRRSTLNPGKIVCNKCGLYERTHLRPRPLRFDELRAGNKARKNSSAAQQQAGQGGAGGRKESASPKVKGASVKKEPREYGLPRRSSVSSPLSVYSSPPHLPRPSTRPPRPLPALPGLGIASDLGPVPLVLALLAHPTPLRLVLISLLPLRLVLALRWRLAQPPGHDPAPQCAIERHRVVLPAPLAPAAAGAVPGAGLTAVVPAALWKRIPPQHQQMVMQPAAVLELQRDVERVQQLEHDVVRGAADVWIDGGMHQQALPTTTRQRNGHRPHGPSFSTVEYPITALDAIDPSINASSLNSTSSPLNNITPTTRRARRARHSLFHRRLCRSVWALRRRVRVSRTWAGEDTRAGRTRSRDLLPFFPLPASLRISLAPVYWTRYPPPALKSKKVASRGARIDLIRKLAS
ncbi:Homobasidiomycete-specific transcription factor [Salix suchowensis]|nr:Homobasidiomycete-specific transcription factor [Salix suchowensis]